MCQASLLLLLLLLRSVTIRSVDLDCGGAGRGALNSSTTRQLFFRCVARITVRLPHSITHSLTQLTGRGRSHCTIQCAASHADHNASSCSCADWLSSRSTMLQWQRLHAPFHSPVDIVDCPRHCRNHHDCGVIVANVYSLPWACICIYKHLFTNTKRTCHNVITDFENSFADKLWVR